MFCGEKHENIQNKVKIQEEPSNINNIPKEDLLELISILQEEIENLQPLKSQRYSLDIEILEFKSQLGRVNNSLKELEKQLRIKQNKYEKFKNSFSFKKLIFKLVRKFDKTLETIKLEYIKVLNEYKSVEMDKGDLVKLIKNRNEELNYIDSILQDENRMNYKMHQMEEELSKFIKDGRLNELQAILAQKIDEMKEITDVKNKTDKIYRYLTMASKNYQDAVEILKLSKSIDLIRIDSLSLKYVDVDFLDVNPKKKSENKKTSMQLIQKASRSIYIAYKLLKSTKFPNNSLFSNFIDEKQLYNTPVDDLVKQIFGDLKSIFRNSNPSLIIHTTVVKVKEQIIAFKPIYLSNKETFEFKQTEIKEIKVDIKNLKKSLIAELKGN
ncbi:MAG: hypothetical protein OEY49_12415 [Candidatus Heimdallarchaeota archaeon]|nr:hypothetical protein [Candidatus Heimdallarchaeota archaeon]